MLDKRYEILEDGKHKLLGVFRSREVANDVCELLNTRKRGKKIYYINKYSVVEMRANK